MLGWSFWSLSLLTLAMADWKDIPDLIPIHEGNLKISELGLPEVGHVIATGYFSTHRGFDCVVLDETRTQVFIYTMRGGGKDVKYSKSLAMASAPAGNEIVNVVMSDFDHDGNTDLMMIHKKLNSKAEGESSLEMSLFLGNGKELIPSQWPLPTLRTQPIFLDWTGSMQIDFLAMSKHGAGEVISLWKANAANRDSLNTGYSDPISLPSLGTLSSPHWSAYADFNGDGLADLFLYKGGIFEIWTRLKKDSNGFPFKLAMRKTLPSGTGPISIADFDGDGHLDLVFSVCNPPKSCHRENSLHVMYNIQKRFCSSHRTYPQGCLNPERDLFTSSASTSDVSVEFDFDTTPNTPDHLVFHLKDLFSNEQVVIQSFDPITQTPLSMAIGDYDLDSYPDIAVVVGKSKSLYSGRVALLRNVQCVTDGKLCTQGQVEKERRAFVEVTGGVQFDALRNLKGVASVAFMDWYNNGPPGLLVNQYEEGTARLRHVTITNGIIKDSFALRIESLNGACPYPCRNAPGAASKSKHPYQVNFIGATFRFSYVDPSGATQVRIGSQLCQTGNRALMGTTMLFGLGSTSNFVQRVDCGIFTQRSKRYHSATNVIPNSEIIFIPPHADQVEWKAELYINPGEYVFHVLISLISALFILAVITGIFKWQEKREDDIERRRTSHLVNFDAL